MAAAAYLIREAGVPGGNISICERRGHPGRSLDIFGDPTSWYVYPGRRLFERESRRAFDVFSFIPSRTDPDLTIKDEATDFNARFGSDSRARLIDKNGEIIPQCPSGLRFHDRLDMLRVLLTPDRMLQGKSIEDCVSPAIFGRRFWFIWRAILAFPPISMPSQPA
ncbi:MAG: hypothetical protein GY789_17320 [Hyphomicrobiales bacterium]|nr:hypothetical protein [Hyphomicrobiales bacterium]